MSDLARAILRNAALLGLIAAAIALSMASCTGADSTPKPQATKSTYTIDQLRAWREVLSNAVWDLGLVSGSGLDETRRQIIFHTYALRDVRKAIEAEISKFNVPRDAVFIDVGCENFRQWPPGPLKPLNEIFLNTIKVSMEIPTKVTYGETVPLKLTLQNVGDKPVAFLLGGNPYHDFVITTPDGEGVWYWRCTRYSYDVLGGGNLEPGEEIEFVEEWQQVNIRGEPVPPGIYFVYGVLETGEIEVPRAESHVTIPHQLEILKP